MLVESEPRLDKSHCGFMQDQVCLTYPMTSPGGALTSSSCRQQGNRQESQRSGLLRWSTSLSALSLIIMSNGLWGPQTILVQQSVSSLAL